MTDHDTIEVRQAVLDDCPAIAMVLADAFRPYRDRYTPEAFEATVVSQERMRARLEEGVLKVWVAVSGPRVVGTVSLEAREGADLHITTMAVDPKYQGMGVGQTLFEAILEYANEQGFDRLSLETSAPLSKAHASYERWGFKRTGRVRPFFGTEVFEMVRVMGPV